MDKTDLLAIVKSMPSYKELDFDDQLDVADKIRELEILLKIRELPARNESVECFGCGS